MTQEHAGALKASTVCRLLSDAEIREIAEITELKQLGAGVELFRENDPGDGLYLVLEGNVDVLKRTPTGERSLAQLGANGVLGEMSLLTDDARSATARALVPSRVLRIPVGRFRELIGTGAPAALKVVAGLAEMLARRVGSMNAKMLELAEQAQAGQEESPQSKTEKFIELQRSLQVWSL